MRCVQHVAIATIVLGASPPLAAQGHGSTAQPARWIVDLGDGPRAWRAVQWLAAQGATMVDPLLAVIDQRVEAGPDDRLCTMALFALVKIGDPARDAAPHLFELLQSRAQWGGLVERQLSWAIGELGSRDDRIARSLAKRLHFRVLREPDGNRFEREIAQLRLELGPEPTSGLLVDLLHTGDLSTLVAVAGVLLRDKGALDAELRAALLAAFKDAVAAQDQQPLNYRDRAINELARAVAVRLPPGEERTVALAHLVCHFDPDVRLEAVRQLRGRGAAVVPFLCHALGDGAVEIRNEAVTALGTLGRAGADAVPDLEQIAAGDDRQLAERARASLRAIHSVPSK